MLSDREIRDALECGDIVVDPWPLDKHIQPASIDVHLGNRFGRLVTDSKEKRLTDPSEVHYYTSPSIVIHPHEFVLGQLAERVSLNAGMVARIEGKSSNGRKGLAIHVTAGFVDPGWDGILTVELYNASHQIYRLHAGDPIGQLAFDRLAVHSERPYGHPELGSHYQGSTEVAGSR